MNQEVKDYEINKTKTLIDINKNLVNFNVFLHVQPKSSFGNYEVAILTQNDLDNSPEIKYQQVRGPFSKNFGNKDNNYQNFYLVLKSAQPQTVTVTLKLTPLATQENSPQGMQGMSPQEMTDPRMQGMSPQGMGHGMEQGMGDPRIPRMHDQGMGQGMGDPRIQGMSQQYQPSQEELIEMKRQEIVQKQEENPPQKVAPKKKIWKYIFWGCVALIVIFLIYKFFISKNRPEFITKLFFKGKKNNPQSLPEASLNSTLPLPIISEVKKDNSIENTYIKELSKELSKEMPKEIPKEMPKEINVNVNVEIPKDIKSEIVETVKSVATTSERSSKNKENSLTSTPLFSSSLETSQLKQKMEPLSLDKYSPTQTKNDDGFGEHKSEKFKKLESGYDLKSKLKTKYKYLY